MAATRIPNLLTIAGVDPSGGAGIIADLKAFAALGGYGMAVVTALTAQNTQGVTGVQAIDPDFIARQIDTIYDDIRVDAVKIGMLANAEVIAVVADRLVARHRSAIVLDPVMVATSGDRLLEESAIAALKERLLPLADVITPNLPEAAMLLDRPIAADIEEMRDAARALCVFGARVVVLKGGHRNELDAIDIVDDGRSQTFLTAPRVATNNTHGTGCTLSAAIAALLARGHRVDAAVAEAKHYLTAALAASDRLEVGSGHGPVHHFHAWWDADQT